jgi:hypothetical protein
MPKLDLIEVRFNAETPPRHPRRAGAPTASTATDPGGEAVADGVDGDEGWPLCLARYAALLAKSRWHGSI